MIDEILGIVRHIGKLLVELQREVAMTPRYRKGLVIAVDAVNRTVDVQLSDGVINRVPLVVGQTLPAQDDVVWVVRHRPRQYLYHGKQG